MKTIALLLAFLTGSVLFAQSETNDSLKTGTIHVTIPNVSSDQGEVLLALYQKENFLSHAPKFHAMSKIENGVADATFENVPEGTYAIVLYHDKNGNKQMDFDTNGMPLEDYGGSGNAMSYGPPNWEDCKFDFHQEKLEMEIRL